MRTTEQPKLSATPLKPSFTSLLMQNYRLAAPVSAGSQIAVAPNRATGESEVLSIGSSGHVFRISPDPASDTGWNLRHLNFPGDATNIAAAGNTDGTLTVYASGTDNQIYRSGYFTNLIAANGNDNYLQVFGIESDGFAYIAVWQNGTGSWFPGIKLPGQSVKLTQLVTGTGNDNQLQVIGLGQDGLAYLVAWQDPKGTWHAGSRLPSSAPWKALATGNGNGNQLQVIGLGLDGTASVVAWQDSNGTWSAGSALPSTAKSTALAIGNGHANQLQVLGLAADGTAQLIARQNQTGQWFAGSTLPSPPVPLTSLCTGSGNNNMLQVIGLGQDGLAYLVAWQDGSGTWSPGFQLPNPSVQLTALVTGRAPDNSLEVIGLGSDEQAYLVARLDGKGSWSGGELLPGQTIPLTEIATGNGNSSNLQVLGTSENGDICLAAWQNTNLAWSAGRQLASGWQALPAAPDRVNGMKVGYDTDNNPFLVIAVRSSSSPSFGYFSTLLDGSWSNFGSDSSNTFGWAPALVPFSDSDQGVHKGAYVAMTDIRTNGDRGVNGEVLFDEFGKYALGQYTVVSCAQTTEGYSALFALSAADRCAYYLYVADPSNEQLSAVKLSGETAIVDIAAGSDASDSLELFALSSEAALYHIRQDPQSQTGWSTFLQLNADLKFTQLVAGKNPAGFTDLFAVTTTDQLYHIRQDPESNDWHFNLIDLPTKGAIEQFASYSVKMSVFDNNNVLAPNTQVQIFSDDPVMLQINGASRFIDAAHPWTGNTNAAGEVTIAMRVSSLGVPPLTVWTSFMPPTDRIAVDPSAPVRDQLASITVQQLSDAMVTADDGTQTPLLPGASDTTLQAIVSAVTRTFSLTQTAPEMNAAFSTNPYHRNDPRVARYLSDYDGSSPNLIHLPSVTDQSWEVDFASGAPVFRTLTAAQYQELTARSAWLPAATSFFGLDLDWGDVFDSVTDGIARVVCFAVNKTPDGIRATLQLVIQGTTYVFDSLVTLVEQAFDLAEEVFKAAGVAFDDLFRWLGFIFGWQDILRTHQVINYCLDQVFQFVKAVARIFQQDVHDYITTLQGQVHDAFAQARSSIIGTGTLLGFQESFAPSMPDQGTVVDHNPVWNGFTNNTHTTSAPGDFAIPTSVAEAIQNLISVLEQNADSFQQSNAFATAGQYISQTMTSPDQFLLTTLSGALTIIEDIAVFGLQIADAVIQLILTAVIELLDAVYSALSTTWDIPVVSDLYYSVSGNTLSILDLGSLIVAVPATAIYKEIESSAPFPDEASIDQFKAAFNVNTLLQSSGLVPTTTAAAARARAVSRVEAASNSGWAKLFQIGAWLCDWSTYGCRSLLDANKALQVSGDRFSPLARIDQVVSTVSLCSQSVGLVLKCPWPWGDAEYSCHTKAGFQHIMWTYHFFGPLPINIATYMWRTGGQQNRTILRASGDVGALLSTILGGIDGVLYVIKMFIGGKDPDEVMASDVMTFVPDFLALCRVSVINHAGRQIPLPALVVTGAACGYVNDVVGFKQIVAPGALAGGRRAEGKAN